MADTRPLAALLKQLAASERPVTRVSIDPKSGKVTEICFADARQVIDVTATKKEDKKDDKKKELPKRTRRAIDSLNDPDSSHPSFTPIKAKK